VTSGLGDFMTVKAFLLAFGLAIASFGAVSLAAPSEAMAHAGHHAAPAAAETADPAAIMPDAPATLAKAADDLTEGQCLNVCCVGASCCPSTLAVPADEAAQFPSAVKLTGFNDAPRPEPAVEPLPEPPRYFV